MTIPILDSSSAILNWLKTHADAAPIRALIYKGADNIFEPSDLDATRIEDDTKARAASEETSKVLAVTVHDAGAVRKGEFEHEEYVIIRIFDRYRSYRGIRALRAQIIATMRECLQDYSLALAASGVHAQMLLSTRYRERTGHRLATEVAASYEAIVFTCTVIQEEL